MHKKKEHHEEHIDETWLIPYADMLTLLLALFIVMFAMSKVDSKKMKEISQQFNVIFAGGKGVMIENGTGQGIISSVKSSTSSYAANSKIEQDMMNKIKEGIDKEIENNGYTGKIKSDLTDEGLAISIQDVVLFKSGDSTVLNNIYPMLLDISKMIHDLDNNIKVTGHTDNVPILTQKFHSNWELSAARAINVMNFMVSSGGIDEKRFSIQAYGEYAPEVKNDTEQGRAKNRRVQIFILRKYSLK